MSPTSAPATSGPVSFRDICWQNAYDSLKKPLKTQLDVTRTQRRDIVRAVLQAAEAKRKECTRKEWKSVTPGGKNLVLRDVVQKIEAWVDRFVAVGEDAAQNDSFHAALPWAAVRFLLNIAVGDIKEFGSMIGRIETISRILFQASGAEKLQSATGSDDSISTQLLEALSRLYAEILKTLAKMVDYFGTSTPGRMMRSALESSDPGEMTDIIEAEKELFKLVSLLLTESSQNPNEENHQLTQGLSDSLTELDLKETRLIDDAASSRSSVTNDNFGEFLNWLSDHEYWLPHQSISRKRLPGTAAWVTLDAVYQEWISSSWSSMTVLHGIRGCGKTMITSSIIDSFQAEKDRRASAVPVAYVYCARLQSDPDRSSSRTIFSSLLRQLAVTTHTSEPTVHHAVWSSYTKAAEKAKSQVTDLVHLETKQCVDLLIDVTAPGAAYIVIDAVDELEDADIYELLDGLHRVVSDSPGLVKVFLSCRDDTRLETLLGKLTPEMLQLRVTAEKALSDVQIFVAERLHKVISEGQMLGGRVSPNLQAHITSSLLDKTGESFLWADRQILYLCRQRTEQDIVAALERTSSQTLEDLLERTFREILDSDTTSKELAIQMFAWIMFSQQPLTAEALFSALEPSRNENSTVTPNDASVSMNLLILLDVGHNLIEHDSVADTIQFCHPLVKDFLSRQDVLSPVAGHHLLARSCLDRCMKGPDQQPFPAAHSPIKNFYHYAAIYWAQHVAKAEELGGDPNDELVDLLEAFVSDKRRNMVHGAFVAWLTWVKVTTNALPPYHPLQLHLSALPSETNSPLFAISLFGLEPLMVRILDRLPNLDLDARNNLNLTSLYLASSKGHEAIVSLLLKHGADLRIKCGKYGTCLQAASFNGHIGTVKTLLAHGIPVQDGGSFRNALEAAFQGSKECMATYLVEEHDTIQSEDDYEMALHGALKAGFRDLVELLLEHTRLQSFRQTMDQDGIKQLFLDSIRGGEVRVLQTLLSSMPDMRDALPSDGVSIAAFHGRANMMIFLKQLGLSKDEPGIYGLPLRAASVAGHERPVRTLLGWGVDVDACSRLGYALQAASMKGHVAIVRILLQEGASVNALGPPFGTALQAAAYYGHTSTVRMLLDAGADARNPGFARDALHAAVEGNHGNIAILILERGYKIGRIMPLSRNVCRKGAYDDRTPREGDRYKDILKAEDQAIKASDGLLGVMGPKDRLADDSDRKLYRPRDKLNSSFLPYRSPVYALSICAATGDLKTLALLLEENEFFYQKWEAHDDLKLAEKREVKDAMLAAARHGRFEACKVLLDHGLRFVPEYAETLKGAAVIASNSGHNDIVELILSRFGVTQGAREEFLQGLPGEESIYHGPWRRRHMMSLGYSELEPHSDITNGPLWDYEFAISMDDDNGSLSRHESAIPMDFVSWKTEMTTTEEPSGQDAAALIEACFLGDVRYVKHRLRTFNKINIIGTRRMCDRKCYRSRSNIRRSDVSHLMCEGELTPLLAACRRGHLEVVKILLSHGADVNVILDEDRYIHSQGLQCTALMAASDEGHLEIVKELLEAGADPNQGNPSHSALLKACKGGHLQVVQALLAAGATIASPLSPPPLFTIGGPSSQTEFSDMSRVPYILKAIIHDYYSITRVAKMAVLEVLLQEACKREGSAEVLNEALKAAAYKEDANSLELILGYMRPSIDSLIQACICGSNAAVKRLIDEGVNVDQRDGRGNLVLHVAAFHLRPEVVQTLINHGADVNGIAGDLSSPLSNVFDACLRGLRSTLHLRKWRMTRLPCDFKTKKRCGLIVRCLVTNGARIANPKNWWLGGILHIACYVGDESLVEWLIERGAKVNENRGYFCTPLFAALEGGHLHVVRLLLRKGADPEQARTMLAENGMPKCIPFSQSTDDTSESGSETMIQTPLMMAMESTGDPVLLYALLSAHPPPQVSQADLIVASKLDARRWNALSFSPVTYLQRLETESNVQILLASNDALVLPEKAMHALLGVRYMPQEYDAFLRFIFTRYPHGVNERMLMTTKNIVLLRKLLQIRPIAPITNAVLESHTSILGMELLLGHSQDLVPSHQVFLNALESSYSHHHFWSGEDSQRVLAMILDRNPALVVTEQVLKSVCRPSNVVPDLTTHYQVDGNVMRLLLSHKADSVCIPEEVLMGASGMAGRPDRAGEVNSKLLEDILARYKTQPVTEDQFFRMVAVGYSVDIRLTAWEVFTRYYPELKVDADVVKAVLFGREGMVDYQRRGPRPAVDFLNALLKDEDSKPDKFSQGLREATSKDGHFTELAAAFLRGRAVSA